MSNHSNSYDKGRKGWSPHELTCHLIGDIGRWQCITSILMSLIKFSVPWVQLGIVFLAFPQKFWCKKPSDILNEDWKNQTGMIHKGHCDVYLNSTININETVLKNSSRIPCEDFEFDTSIYKTTIVSDWNLVCSKAHYVELSQAFLMFGVLLGNLIFGVISDRHGRRISLLFCIILQIIGGLASAVTLHFWGFILSRLLLALASGGITTVTFVLCLETVGGKWKNIIPILYHIPFGLGNTVMAGLANVLRNWRHLQFSLTILSSTYLFFIIFIHESPRWLLATGQTEKAIKTIEKICLCNGRNVKDVRCAVIESLEGKIKPAKTEITSIFTSKNLRAKSVVLWIECFLSGISFFAFVQYLGIVGENIFLNVALNGLSVIPGTILTLIFLKYCNYKKTIIASLVWTAICFMLIVTVPPNVYVENWPKIICALLGIMGLSIALPVLSIYIGLIYPSEVRNVGVGIAMMFIRLGSIISPFLVHLDKISWKLPHILLCVLTLIQAVLLCLMPDINETSTLLSVNYSENNNNRNLEKQTENLMATNCYKENEDTHVSISKK